MKKFQVGVTWRMGGYIIVKAETKEEAIEKAEYLCIQVPKKGVYMDDSLLVDVDDVEEIGALIPLDMPEAFELDYLGVKGASNDRIRNTGATSENRQQNRRGRLVQSPLC